MLESLTPFAHRLRLAIVDHFHFLVPKKRGGIYHYFLAIVLISLALWVRLTIAPVEAGLQYLTSFPAVALAAITGGYRAGLLAVIIGIAFATYIFTPPYYSFSTVIQPHEFSCD
jgi:K+-sensing histidine kinase KdpD